ncbi:MAG: hypothetical protein J0L74_11610, partial [Burkholderiales bacterium]|nr:hypothetical protein [Burkholderiales bacterium]
MLKNDATVVPSSAAAALRPCSLALLTDSSRTRRPSSSRRAANSKFDASSGNITDALVGLGGSSSSSDPRAALYAALLAVHDDDQRALRFHVDRCRALLDSEVSALVRESYNRAYSMVLRLHQLVDLEEMSTYRRLSPDQQGQLRDIWTRRLLGAQRNVEYWQHLLSTRALVIPPTQDLDVWLKFVSLCRKTGKVRLAQNTLASLAGFDAMVDARRLISEAVDPSVCYFFSFLSLFSLFSLFLFSLFFSFVSFSLFSLFFSFSLFTLFLFSLFFSFLSFLSFLSFSLFSL